MTTPSEVIAAAVVGPAFISLQVRDLDRSRAFYAEHLGLTPAPQSPPDAVVFLTEPTPFAIRKLLVDGDAITVLGSGVSLWMAATDPDALHARLQGAGVPIVIPIGTGPFGRFFAFRDPDGYTVTICGLAPRAIAKLDPATACLTFINTFTVEPENADALLASLNDATAAVFVHQPGFISANLHVSSDRRRIVNYAQWRSKADYQAMSTRPEVQQHMRASAALATGYDPVDYELRATIVGA